MGEEEVEEKVKSGKESEKSLIGGGGGSGGTISLTLSHSGVCCPAQAPEEGVVLLLFLPSPAPLPSHTYVAHAHTHT